MSNYTIAKVSLKHIDRSLLEKVLEKIASKIGARFVKENAIVKYFGGEKKVDYLLEKCLPFGNGYGIIVNRNDLEIHADIHGADIDINELKNMVTREYLTNLFVKMFSQKGTISVSEEKDKTIIYVYSYGET